MRIGIIQFPGSNCERETMLAVARAGMTPIPYLWNEPTEKLLDLDGYVIVGGFSYEDRSRSGIIAALDPVMNLLKTQSDNKKPLLGICNGAQILVEAGLVPGLAEGNEKVALTYNKRISQDKILGTGYYNAWVHLKLTEPSVAGAFTRHLTPATPMHVPVAHGEGRFLIPPLLLKKMQAAGLIVMQYSTAQGEIIDTFPTNPNGSVNNIAAICNPAGNVLAMMPHPERTTEGDSIFLSMRDYIAQRSSIPSIKNGETIASLSPSNTKHITKPYTPQGSELIIGQILTDNHAFSVENTLRKMGIPVKITRHIHWEISSPSNKTLSSLKASGVLYNDQKEFPVTLKQDQTKRSFLVRAKEDLVGLQKRQQFMQLWGLEDLEGIQYGILWHIQAEDQLLEAAIQNIFQSGILFNPLSQECYHYV